MGVFVRLAGRRGEEPIVLADWEDWGELAVVADSEEVDDHALLVFIVAVFVDYLLPALEHS